MPFELYLKPNFGKRFRYISIAAAQAGVAAGTMSRASRVSRLYTSINGLWGHTAAPPAPPPWAAPTMTLTGGTLPLTGDTGGTKTIVMDINFGSHDIPAGGKTATITYNVGAADATVTANLTAGMTPNQQCTAIAAALNGVATLGAVKAAGTTITVTPTDTTVLSKLTLSVA